MMDAATGRSHNIVEAEEVAHEQGLGAGAFRVEAAICHGLPAAGLIAWIHDLVSETLKQLESGSAHFGKESVNVARNEQCYSHMSPSGRATIPTVATSSLLS